MKVAIPDWPFKIRKLYLEETVWINPGILRLKTNLQNFNIKLPIFPDLSLATDMTGPAEVTLLTCLLT